MAAAALGGLASACVEGATGSGGEFRGAALATARGATVEIALRTAPEQPPERGSIAVDLYVTELASGRPIAGLTVTVTPWMPAMGHGIGSIPLVVDAGLGHYQIDELGLFMAGGWVLKTDVVGLPGVGEDHVELAVEVQ